MVCGFWAVKERSILEWVFHLTIKFTSFFYSCFTLDTMENANSNALLRTIVQLIAEA